jgi:hypothetical protein
MPAANTLRLDDGFSTIITFANIPTIKIFEKEVTPPGITSGGPIDTTTMRNTAWRTMSPRQLKSLTGVSATVAFATDAIDAIMAQIAVNQLVTVTFPDGSSIEFYGWLEEFTPGSFKEGEQPTAALKVQPSNRDNNGVETEPNYIEPGSLT